MKPIKTGFKDRHGNEIFARSKIAGQVCLDSNTRFVVRVSWRATPPDWTLPVSRKHRFTLADALATFTKFEIVPESTPTQYIHPTTIKETHV